MPMPMPMQFKNPMYDPQVAGVSTGVVIQSDGFWAKLKKPWWPRAKTGVLIGSGVFITGVILCACHIPIGGLLIAGGIVIIIGSAIYAIFTDVE